MRRVAAAAASIAAGLSVLAFARPAYADRGVADRGGFAWCGERSCPSGVHRTEELRRQQPARAQTKKCTYTPNAVPDGAKVYELDGTEIIVDGTGSWYAYDCIYPDGTRTGGLVYVRPRTPEQLREEAFEELPFPAPGVVTYPPADRLHLVNLRTWLSLGDGWGELSSTTSVPGVSVTVRAQPSRVVWDMGNGDTVVCEGPGAVYDPSRPDAEQSTDCSYRWTRSSASQPNGTYHVTATVEWQVSWSIEGAPGGGELPAVRRSTTLQVRVGEGQARSGATR